MIEPTTTVYNVTTEWWTNVSLIRRLTTELVSTASDHFLPDSLIVLSILLHVQRNEKVSQGK